jgi:hypothetical protein
MYNFNLKPNMREIPVRVGILSECKKIKSFPDTYEIILTYKGMQVGVVKLEKIFGEKNTYFVFDLVVPDKYQKDNPQNPKKHEYFGFGTALIYEVNLFLKEKKALGVLDDGITKKTVLGMYRRHGWNPVPSNIIKTTNKKQPLFFDGARV